MRRLGSLVIAGLAAGAPAASAAAPEVFTSTRDVHACLVLERGVIAGTGGGLVDIDWRGQVRGVKTALDGLGGTRVRALLRSGDHLVAGTERGLAFVRLRRGGLVVDRTLPSKPVRALAESHGVVYVGTWGQGLLRLDARRSRLIPVRFAGAARRGRDRITAVIEHRDTVYAAAGNGVYKLAAGKLVEVARTEATIWALASHEGDLYAGTTAGLLDDRGPGLSRLLAAGDVRALSSDGRELVAGTFGDGAYRYRGRLVRAGLPRDASFVQAIERRSQGSCVAGRGGVWLREAGSQRWIAAVLPAGPPSNDISAIARDGRRLWVGTFDQGLAVFDGARWRRFEHPRVDPKINALAVAGDTVWVATAAGLSAIRGERVSRLGPRDGLPSRHVLSLAAMPGGRLLVGTTQGAAIIEAGRVTPLGRKQGVLVGNVWAVAADDDGFIWLGSTRGLFRGKPGGSWARYSLSSEHLRDDWVMALAISGRRAYVGSYKGGVVRFDWSETEPANVSATPLGAGWINPGGLTVAGGTLYAATMDGLVAGDGASARWRPLPGGPGADTTAVLVAGSSLWIATRRGLLRRPL